MSIASAQEFATIVPAWSMFTAGYLLRDADHQVKVFKSDVGQSMAKLIEDKLGLKLLSVMYLGRRQLNLRTDKEIKVPADLAGIKLRMPGGESWQFLGKALGASPLPMAFTEVYTALQTGAIDGQDNPLPTDKDFEVLRSHEADRPHQPSGGLELPDDRQEGLGQVHPGPAGGRSKGGGRRKLSMPAMRS